MGVRGRTAVHPNGEAVNRRFPAYPGPVTYVLLVATGVLVLCLVIWVGHSMVRNPAPNGGGIADGLGTFNEVFDPARARADEDLKSKDNQREIVPMPEDEGDQPFRIDHLTMRAHIKRPAPSPAPPSSLADPSDPQD